MYNTLYYIPIHITRLIMICDRDSYCIFFNEFDNILYV